MDWRDEGILLSARPHGESSALIDVFTANHGRHAGVVRGGASRKIAPILQPAAQLDVRWHARLEEHVGSYSVEPMRSRAALVMGDRLGLSGLNAVVALLGFCLPDREPHGALYQQSVRLLDLLGQNEIWPLAYLQWEQRLLEDMGYGLDLDSCAVTGATDGLVYVSPKSGRAVSAQGAGDWADRLLPLPDVLLGQGDATDRDIHAALGVTGYFLSEKLARDMSGRPLPASRDRFLDAIQRRM